jgi:3-phenylpropionate/trans-cinnamate dioxygenase ferredoxin reductase subunit
VANAFHPRYGTRVRLEHWSAALNQGPVAAKNMLGDTVAYERTPYFFSDQYDLGMGWPTPAPRCRDRSRHPYGERQRARPDLR